MSDRFEPDDQFVDRLEWQLASEFRRKDRLRPATGNVTVPRSVVAASLAAGILLLGVAATKAADLIKDSWRKKIEIARLETDIKIKTAHLELRREAADKAGAQAAAGLIREEEYEMTKLAVTMSALGLERTMLDLEEVKASGEAPRDELYAPAVGGRDFVSERLMIDKRGLDLDLELRRGRIGRLEQLVSDGLASSEDLDAFRASMVDQEATLESIERRLALRRRFVAGELSAEEIEIEDRMASAERDMRLARSTVEIRTKQLERLQALEAKGMISKTEVQQARFGLDAALAQQSLAALELDVLNKIK